MDLIAKSNQEVEDTTILTKCVSQLDNFKTQHSSQMIALSKFFGGIPLLIANCYRNNQYLRDETLYMRHDIHAINLYTLKNLLKNNISPYKIAMRGSSVSIKISGTKLKHSFESIQNSKTKNDISRELEISRQTLSNYQTGQSLPSEETFQRILNFFNEITKDVTKEDLIDPINILDTNNIIENDVPSIKNQEIDLKGFKGEVNQKLKELNFSNQWFSQLPWNGVSIDNEIRSRKLLFFTGLGESEQFENLLNRINSTQKVVKLFNNKSIWIIQDEKVIPEIEQSLLNKSSNVKILSFHELPDLKKQQKK